MDTYESKLPKPFSEKWRDAYRYTDKDMPRKSSYQAPVGQPVEFVLDMIRLGSGQSVDTAEYPFHGFWSNTSLNEKPHTISISGHLCGSDYIARRNELITALQVPTSDDDCGHIELPLWGRFSVVVATWEIEEAGKENGQCKISITFTRAGWAEKNRLEYANRNLTDLDSRIAELNKVAADAFTKKLNGKTDIDMLVTGFDNLKSALIAIVGCIQGAKTVLNNMTNKVNSITNLIAQGVRSPAELAQALISACAGIATGVLEVRNAVTSTISYFSADTLTVADTVPVQFIKNNTKNVLIQFFSANSYALREEAITETQQVTKAEIENLYRTVSYGVCAALLAELETSETYNKQSGLWLLFSRLESRLNQEDSAVFASIEKVRIDTAQILRDKNAKIELLKEIKTVTPILLVALYLGCDVKKLRELNNIADSFLLQGAFSYV